MKPFNYAFWVSPQRELAAQKILRARGYDVFVPVETKFYRRKHAKKREEKTYPMMVGYIFIGFDDPSDWPAVMRFDVVKSIVGFGGCPSRFTAKAMLYLHGLSGESIAHKASVNTRKSFAPGDMVSIERGALKGTSCRVESVRGQKARLVFELLGCPSIEVPVDALEAA